MNYSLFSPMKNPQKSIGNLIDSGLFYILWQQVRAAFRSLNPTDMDEELTAPDWILISRDGVHQLLQLTLELFLQVRYLVFVRSRSSHCFVSFQRMHKCLSLLIQPESVMFESLSIMLSKELIEQLDVK